MLAKVSWSMLCLPKKEGGLGIKKLEELNSAVIYEAHLESLRKGQVSLGSLGGGNFIEG
jgi:hypothetical protein